MIAFRVKHFDQLSVRAAADRLFTDFISALPSSVRTKLMGEPGRFVWIHNPKGGSYSENDVLSDVRNRGPLYIKIMKELLAEADEL